MRLRSWPSALMVLALAAGCGTTLPVSRQGPGGANPLADASNPTDSPGAGAAPGGTGAPGSASGPLAGGSGGTVGATVTGGAGGTGADAAGPSGAGSGASAEAIAAAGSAKRTASEGATSKLSSAGIRVGFFYVQGGNQVISDFFPGSSVSFGDGQAEAKAMVDYVNSHGGINGQKLIPYYTPVQPQNATDTGLQQACEGMVQDDHPFVILSIFNVAEGLTTCAAKAGIPLIDIALGAGDNYIYDQFPGIVFSPTQVSRDQEQKLVLGLAYKEGRISKAAPVGVLSETDDPMYNRVVDGTIVPLLKGWGIPYDLETISGGDDTQGLSSAVLKFKSAGVKQVAFSLGYGGIPEVLFMQDANQQLFFPGYLMGDSTDPAFVSSAGPSTEVKSIWGAGTMPLADVADNQYPTTPREQLCMNIMNSSFGAGYSNRGSSLTFTMYCDQVLLFTAVAKTVTGNLSAESWVGAYRRMGTSYAPVTTFASNLSAGGNTNASYYRELSYSAGCTCVTYTSAQAPIP